ncbi:MAG: biotin--[acetyl-CoA-carboxylase] ligase [Bacteroidetes bacterium]|nr:biotin--[acetyl-CoA-carboxylase] ligase [Bacteroidota bacterium]MBS1756345.1 biotin--[acetyl-CoA-carboxylase] ligase [Bacteroidota bacterium]
MKESELFSILNSVDSTNNYAMRQVHAAMARHGMAWFAQEQTAGKGQRGKIWQTGKGENIALSIVLEPKGLAVTDQFRVSVAVSLGCFDFFNTLCNGNVSIKWPNDIYWNDRKAGGILIENVLQGKNWKYAIAGIGININQEQFDPSIKNPVSLKIITGKSYDTAKLAKQLYQKIMGRINDLINGDFVKMLEQYNQYLYKKNKDLLLKKNGIEFNTCIKGVNALGKLLTTDIIDNEFDFGEVEWMI